MQLFYSVISLVILLVYGEDRTRLIAIGDLHGGYRTAIESFQLAQVTDGRGHWIGGNYTTVIQTGDVVDRGSDTIQLYNWLLQLRDEAHQAGGQFIQLLGNHELLNLQENYKDVSDEDIQSFVNKKSRKLTFNKTGWIGKYLRELDIVTQVGTTLFTHGGIDPKWLNSSVDEMNQKAHKYLLEDSASDLKDRDIFDPEQGSPLWSRYFANGKEEEVCPVLVKLLKKWQLTRMVVGHTIIKNNTITGKCNNQIIIIDVAISSFYDGGHPAALEIINGIPRALYPNKRSIPL